MKKVSIIVPVYNSEKFLTKCVDSLIQQTINDFEIILVNDASTDKSLEILRSYEAKYPDFIRVINSEINMRQGGARNLGINCAVGEYIGFVDSDDWVKKDMYEKLYSKAKSENFDVVGCNYMLKSSSHEIVVNQYEMSEWENSKNPLTIEERRKLLIESGSIWSKIYRKELLIENNIYFPIKMAYEDNFFVPVVSYHTNSFGVVQDALYYYFQDNTEATTKKKNSLHHLDRLKTSLMLYDWFRDNDRKGIFNEEIEYLYTVYNYINTTDVLNSYYDQINWELIKKLRNEFLEKYPNYYKNKYYIKRYMKEKRLVMRINDKSIHLYSLIYKIKNIIRK